MQIKLMYDFWTYMAQESNDKAAKDHGKQCEVNKPTVSAESANFLCLPISDIFHTTLQLRWFDSKRNRKESFQKFNCYSFPGGWRTPPLWAVQVYEKFSLRYGF